MEALFRKPEEAVRRPLSFSRLAVATRNGAQVAVCPDHPPDEVRNDGVRRAAGAGLLCERRVIGALPSVPLG